jgi:hypothetical protein
MTNNTVYELSQAAEQSKTLSLYNDKCDSVECRHVECRGAVSTSGYLWSM